MEPTAFSSSQPTGSQERRAFLRMPHKHIVRWKESVGNFGWGTLLNVGRTGVCLSISRYLRPGRVVEVAYEGAEPNSRAIFVPARIVWTRSTDNCESFTSGFQVLHEEPKTLSDISEIFYMALREYESASCEVCGTPNHLSETALESAS